MANDPPRRVHSRKSRIHFSIIKNCAIHKRETPHRVPLASLPALTTTKANINRDPRRAQHHELQAAPFAKRDHPTPIHESVTRPQPTHKPAKAGDISSRNLFPSPHNPLYWAVLRPNIPNARKETNQIP